MTEPRIYRPLLIKDFVQGECGEDVQTVNDNYICIRCGTQRSRSISRSRSPLNYRRDPTDSQTSGGHYDSQEIHSFSSRVATLQDKSDSEGRVDLQSAGKVLDVRSSWDPPYQSKDPNTGHDAALRASVVQAISQDEELLRLLRTIPEEHDRYNLATDFPEVLEDYASRLSKSPLGQLNHNIVTLIKSESGPLARSIISLAAEDAPHQRALNLPQYESQAHLGDLEGKEKAAIPQSERGDNDDISTRTKEFLSQGPLMKILRQDLAGLIMSGSGGQRTPQAEDSQFTIMETEDIPCTQNHIAFRTSHTNQYLNRLFRDSAIACRLYYWPILLPVFGAPRYQRRGPCTMDLCKFGLYPL